MTPARLALFNAWPMGKSESAGWTPTLKSKEEDPCILPELKGIIDFHHPSKYSPGYAPVAGLL